MLRKKEKNYNSNITNVKLYLDDIEHIIEILKAENTIIAISDEENIYDSIDELRKIKGKHPNIIKIEGKLVDEPFEFTSIRLSEYSLTIFVHHSDTFLKLAYEIERYVKSKKRLTIYSFLNSRNAKINIVLSIVLALCFYLIYALYYQKEYSITIWIYTISFWGIIFLFCELNPNSNTKIELKRRHESNFWEVNKDKILLIIITATITAVVDNLILRR